ncbi:hypothetical protein JCM19376_12750 [Fusibacter bizertensis]
MLMRSLHRSLSNIARSQNMLDISIDRKESISVYLTDGKGKKVDSSLQQHKLKSGQQKK